MKNLILTAFIALFVSTSTFAVADTAKPFNQLTSDDHLSLSQVMYDVVYLPSFHCSINDVRTGDYQVVSPLPKFVQSASLGEYASRLEVVVRGVQYVIEAEDEGNIDADTIYLLVSRNGLPVLRTAAMTVGDLTAVSGLAHFLGQQVNEVTDVSLSAKCR